MDVTDKFQRLKMGVREYLQALEEERQKIQVFSKELPLSLELVTQAIEACRQQQLSGTTTECNLNGHSECSEQTTSTEGPVLEEFIPIKKRASPDCDEDDDDDEQHSHQPKISKDDSSNDKRKSDWLRSVQLWNSDPPTEEDVNRKMPVKEVKRSGSGGAFHPFHKEEIVSKGNESLSKAPSSTPLAATSSPAVTVTRDNAGTGSSKREEKEALRKQRRCWSQELHKRFLQALQQLGGADSATPKQIRELMKVDGLTNDEVKSHLQKFRLHNRRPGPISHNNGNPQTAPFVLVGNIFVQPQPEYAAAVTSTTTSAAEQQLTRPVAAPNGIYAPVAAHPPLAVAIPKPQFQKAHSEERANHSNSPASSSSTTHTTTTSSPGY